MKQIFDIDINIMENVDLDIIKDIELKCRNNESLTEDEVLYFLSYVSYSVRKLLTESKNQHIENYNFAGDCTNAQSMLKHYFDDLSLKSIPVQTNRIFFNTMQHSFIIVYLLQDGEPTPYILDPTYNQFFDIDKCLASRFIVRDGVVVGTPDPGYFVLNSDEENQKIIKKFLKFGFMELNKMNASIYGDSFYYTQVGLPQKTYDVLSSLNGLYIKFFLQSNFEVSKDREFLKKNNLLFEPLINFKNHNKRV